LLVAASTRTSTSIGLEPPIRVTTPSCSTRSSLACAESDMSPTSSRNRVPPSACSNLPARSANAPVNDPFMWPNSSLSMSSDGIAAQLTSTNASSCRGEASWSPRATSSLPVPFSPVISTRAAVGPTFAISSRTAWSAGLEPTIW
jgi:hypothetical protein